MVQFERYQQKKLNTEIQFLLCKVTEKGVVFRMQYSLGIDAGGTYTDAVLIRDTDGAIVDSNKALTTYPDLRPGIKNVIDGLNPKYLKNIKLVSVSTNSFHQHNS
jgi:activator of 2-hydroxyglutaryl-CoA dehydratase